MGRHQNFIVLFNMRSLRELLQQVRAFRSGGAGRTEQSAVLGSDLLARLPIELHIMLLEYLGADDVVAALNASKALRLAWLSEDVWPWLADRWYPDLSQAVHTEATLQGAMARRLSIFDSSTSNHRVGGHPMGIMTESPQRTAPGLEPGELFRQMLIKLCKRNGGKYASALHHRLQLFKDSIFSLSRNVPSDQGGITSTNDLDEDLLDSTKSQVNVSRFMVYNNGRISWWPNSYSTPYIAVVDDLRTARRKIYCFPDHGGLQRGYRTAMSDELLVIARHATVHAWHFDKDVLSSVAIPEQFERCVAEGSNVLIMTRSAELYIWRFEGVLQRISSSCYQPGPVRMGGLVETPFQSRSPMFHIPRRQGLLLKNNGMLLDLIVHPSLPNIFFVVTMHEGDLIVHEIVEGNPETTYHLHTDTKTTAAQWNEINEYLRWEKCDSYGGYCLFSVYLGVDNELSPSDLQSPNKPFCTCGQKTGLVSVCFNIYTKSFRVQCHHFLHSRALQVDPVPAAFHLWQSKLYTSYAPSDMRFGMPITALRCCLATQERQGSVPDGKIPVYTISEDSRGLLTRRHKSLPEKLSDCPELRVEQIDWRRQVDFGLDVTARCASSLVRSHVATLWSWDAPNVHQTQTIIGDDDFLIYVVDGVYIAWSFRDEIPIPKEAMKWAPWTKA